jgi:hypothetical protein
MCSFIRDELGATEPYTDLPALGIVAVGLIIFSFLLFSAYSSYASSAYYAAVKGDLRNMARAAACDPKISDGAGMLDVHKLDNASIDGFDCGYPGSAVQVTVEAPGYRWRMGQGAHGMSASSMLPVSIKLNDARCIPGTLTITMWERT